MAEGATEFVEVKPIGGYDRGAIKAAMERNLHTRAEKEAARAVARLPSDQRSDPKKVATIIGMVAVAPGGDYEDITRSMLRGIAEKIGEEGLDEGTTGKKILRMASHIEMSRAEETGAHVKTDPAIAAAEEDLNARKERDIKGMRDLAIGVAAAAPVLRSATREVVEAAEKLRQAIGGRREERAAPDIERQKEPSWKGPTWGEIEKMCGDELARPNTTPERREELESLKEGFARAAVRDGVVEVFRRGMTGVMNPEYDIADVIQKASQGYRSDSLEADYLDAHGKPGPNTNLYRTYHGFIAAEQANWVANLVMARDRAFTQNGIPLSIEDQSQVGGQAEWKRVFGWGQIPPEAMGLARANATRIVEKSRTEATHAAEAAREQRMEMPASAMSGWNFKAERKPAEYVEHDVFNPQFVVDHRLPAEIFTPPPWGDTVTYGQDVATLLKQIFKGGKVMPELSWEAIRYTIRDRTKSGKNIGREEANAWRAFGELVGGIIPLMYARFKTAEGSIDSLAGNAKKGITGVLQKGDGNIDFRETIPAFQNDVLAKRALGILLAADGYKVHRMTKWDKKEEKIVATSEDGVLALTLSKRFREIIESGVMKGNPPRPALDKEANQIQRECVAYMDDVVAKQIAVHLGCDIGRVDLMVMFYTALGGGQRVIDYRELYQRFPVLRTADPCYVDPETGLVEGDVIMAPLLRKLKVGDDYRANEEKGQEKRPGVGFGYVERQLEEKGIDGLFGALLNLKDGHDAWKYWAGLGSIFDAMKQVEDFQTGKDSLNSESGRKAKIAELMDPFANGDPPQISAKTLAAIKQMPVSSGKGVLYEAGRNEWDVGALKRRFAEDFGLNSLFYKKK